MDPETKNEIRKVETILDEIRENTATPWWRTVLNGALYGTGVVAGTIIAIFIFGYALSLFGVIPGIGEIATRLQEIMNSKF